MPIKQAERPFELITPLGRDKLVLRQMSGTEQLGTAFEYRIEALSEDANIDLNSLLGEKVTVRISQPSGGERYVNGHVVAFAQKPSLSTRFAAFELRIRPWIALLAKTVDCRIFQNMSPTDIIKQVFRDNGFSDFEDRLSATYEQRVFCVQYRETAYSFVHRLMEEEGIYYYVKHFNGNHVLVLADSKSAHDTLPGHAKIPYFPEANIDRRQKESIYDWNVTNSLQSGKIALKDFDFEIPRKDLLQQKLMPGGHPHDSYELYDYPGDYVEAGHGEHYARVRMEEVRWQHEVIAARTSVHGATPGTLFELEKFPRSDQNREYLITAIELLLEDDPYESRLGGQAHEPVFEAGLSLIPSATVYRPRRITPRPLISGPQTAIVVGPAGDEIHTDKHGRVKCQFHWDRYGNSDENSSCWIRVSQPWAGKNWGSIAIPRIGQEVVVEFEEGDPDRPIITGRVYNGDQKTPYELPANKTQSGTKSRSSKGGSSDNFNELRFEDKKGDEQVYFHAEKNFDRVVENNDTETIGNNQDIKIGSAQAADGSQTEEIWKDRTTTLKTGNDALTVEMGNRDVVLQMGDLSTDVQMGNVNLTLGMGNQATNLRLGKSETQAMQSIEFKVGASSIKIDQMGVTIKGMMIKINGTMMTEVKGMMTTVDGSAMLRLTGGILMIG